AWPPPSPRCWSRPDPMTTGPPRNAATTPSTTSPSSPCAAGSYPPAVGNRPGSPSPSTGPPSCRYPGCAATTPPGYATNPPPGCDRPPWWTEAHHLIWWRHGGRTDLDNLCLLCAFHHHRIHDHSWTLRRDPDGGWTATAPDGRTFHQPPRPLRA